MPSWLRRNLFVLLLLDAALFAASLGSAFLLRFNFSLPAEAAGMMLQLLPFAVLLKMLVFYLFDAYRGMWRYFSIRDFLDIVKAASISSLVLIVAILFVHRFSGFSRAVFIIDWFLTIIFLSSLRLGIRLTVHYFSNAGAGETSSRGFFRFLKDGGKQKNLLILGAGDCGEKIYREIRDNAHLRYNVAGFIDDDPEKVGRQIHGVPVLGSFPDLKRISERYKIEEVLIAIPSASAKQMRQIVESIKNLGIPSKTLPSMGELIDGKVSVKAIRDVAYRDLLGREVIRLEEEEIGRYLGGAVVLVTGAGGSIGSELCRQICRFHPKTLVLFERAESPLYEIDIELKKSFPDVRILPVLGDIRDRRQLDHAFETARPTTVFHAAAYKHVPMMELQPWKAVKNNVIGTRNLVLAANAHQVERFVLVSTDKAVRPTNVMGATKRMAELIVQNQDSCGLSGTRFMIVRFGNVVGSVGSVVPLFRRQIEQGGPVTVTHPEMMRFFMTIPEACQLILQSGAMGRGGEIFILDMGTPIKIAEIARDLIRLSGLEPGVDIDIEYIGLRPGEKLYEELITEGEGIVPTRHEKIMVLRGAACDVQRLDGRIEELRTLSYGQNAAAIRAKIKEMVPEYRPYVQVDS
ncbi:MAG: polysaccharide biosynthesis protein [Desulfobacterales bacterium]|nr:polysaccharide biosynthesis protein [Desulfobacterales bacterium]